MLETNDTCAAANAPREARLERRAHRGRALVLALLAASAVTVGTPRVAHAEEVSPDGKGIIGGALLGGEVVVFAEALFGVRSSTAYLLGFAGGAVGGGIGGYFIEQAVDNGRVPAYLLAGGLALIIPALVVSLDQTRYLPTEGAREDKPLPPSDPGKPGGSTVIGAEPPPAPTSPATPPTTPPTTPAPAPGGGGGTPAPARGPVQGPQSLINLHQGGFRVGVPVPEVRPVFSAAQKKALGVEASGNELRFPVVRVTF